jgi:thiamine kinase-like enzyme
VTVPVSDAPRQADGPGPAHANRGRGEAVDERLDRVPALAGRPRTIEPLTGGLTNRNFKVTTPNGCFVARVSDAHGDLLAIDRAAEYRNSVISAASGVAPRVVDYLPGEGVLVIDWIEGRTLAAADLSGAAGYLTRLAGACRRLHDGPRFVNDFDMFAVQQRYLQLVRRRGFRLPARYGDFLPVAERIRAALAVQAEPTVACHNDLLAENLIDDGAALWLIDYEYAGNNDACFELGNIAAESHLSLDQLAQLVEHYYGADRPDKVARARLFGLMSDYGWTLWACIQDGVSELDFDFWSWGMEKYDRAVAALQGPDLARLLVEVQQPLPPSKGKRRA